MPGCGRDKRPQWRKSELTFPEECVEKALRSLVKVRESDMTCMSVMHVYFPRADNQWIDHCIHPPTHAVAVCLLSSLPCPHAVAVPLPAHPSSYVYVILVWNTLSPLYRCVAEDGCRRDRPLEYFLSSRQGHMWHGVLVCRFTTNNITGLLYSISLRQWCSDIPVCSLKMTLVIMIVKIST